MHAPSIVCKLIRTIRELVHSDASDRGYALFLSWCNGFSLFADMHAEKSNYKINLQMFARLHYSAVAQAVSFFWIGPAKYKEKSENYAERRIMWNLKQ